MENQKKNIIETYKNKKVVEGFDDGRKEFLYQRYKHKIESDFLIKAIKRINSQNKIKILDVACGTGRMLPVVFSQGKDIEYTGLDTSKEMASMLLKKAKILDKEKEIKIKIGDATKIPFKDGAFDLVFTYHLLWHLPKREQEKIIKEMIRVAKVGGTVVFDILNEKFIWEKIKKMFRINQTEGIHKLKISEVKQLIRSKDFEIEKLNDAPIKNNLFYKLFNLINKSRKTLPNNFFHMIYFMVKK